MFENILELGLQTFYKKLYDVLQSLESNNRISRIRTLLCHSVKLGNIVQFQLTEILKKQHGNFFDLSKYLKSTLTVRKRILKSCRTLICTVLNIRNGFVTTDCLLNPYERKCWRKENLSVLSKLNKKVTGKLGKKKLYPSSGTEFP